MLRIGGKMEIRYDTYCGLNCGACPVGLANEQGNVERISEMALEWGSLPEELKCRGCKTEETAVFCTDCRMRVCAREKELEFCIECDDYPCEIISEFRNDEAPHHSAVLKNLELIKKMGLKAWLDAEAKRWSCPECGKRFHWYSENCSECGSSLYNAIAEEKDLNI